MYTEKTQGGGHFLKPQLSSWGVNTTEMVAVKSDIQEHDTVFLIWNQGKTRSLGHEKSSLFLDYSSTRLMGLLVRELSSDLFLNILFKKRGNLLLPAPDKMYTMPFNHSMAGPSSAN